DSYVIGIAQQAAKVRPRPTGRPMRKLAAVDSESRRILEWRAASPAGPRQTECVQHRANPQGNDRVASRPRGWTLPGICISWRSLAGNERCGRWPLAGERLSGKRYAFVLHPCSLADAGDM